MKDAHQKIENLELVHLSRDHKKARRIRNRAIALCLVVMILVFYSATISRLKPKRDNPSFLMKAENNNHGNQFKKE
ncbi:hypothetical protein [Candidatus Endowatersipora endosymbiont of Watersipora subatra]|uniref:hypothetical protein n=1 Tax=Candidatus Endowatersipora endosymbiont of Watersipora subatra TaxID=3077946 RepID=UPI00312C8356